MARSSDDMLRDLLAVVRDQRLHTGHNKAIVDEVAAYLARPSETPRLAPAKSVTPSPARAPATPAPSVSETTASLAADRSDVVVGKEESTAKEIPTKIRINPPAK